ncbi:MAG: Crp/Fnr family transcriptional regulator [Granulosicoccus sp.]
MQTQDISLFTAARSSAVANPMIQDFLKYPAHEATSFDVAETDHSGVFENSKNIVENCKSCDRIVPAGTTLYHEGDVCKKLYILLEGWVSTCRNLQDGRQLILNFQMPGAFLGFQSDLLAPMHNTVRCMTDTVVCEFPRNTFMSLLENSPALELSLDQSKANEEKVIMDNLINIATRPARARVAHFLLDLHARVIEVYAHDLPSDIYFPLTRQDIADTLGLTNVHVSRAICALQRENLLSLKKKRLQIFDFDKLAEIAKCSNR